MRNLVRHNAYDFRLAIGCENGPAVDIEKASGQSERVYIGRLYDLYRERHFRVRVQHDVLAQTVYIFSDDRVGYELAFLVYLGGKLTAYLRLFLQRVKIYRPFVYVPAA